MSVPPLLRNISTRGFNALLHGNGPVTAYDAKFMGTKKVKILDFGPIRGNRPAGTGSRVLR
jgi:hypothetical protein